MKSEKASPLLVALFNKRVFNEYNRVYMDRNGKRLRSEYEKNVKKFVVDMKVPNDVVAEFMELGKKEGGPQNDTDFQKDKEFIRTRLKADIARDLFGNAGWYPVMHTQDNQFQKALTLFPEAGKIAGLK